MKFTNEVCQWWDDIWTERQINFLLDKRKMLNSCQTDGRVCVYQKDSGWILKNVFSYFGSLLSKDGHYLCSTFRDRPLTWTMSFVLPGGSAGSWCVFTTQCHFIRWSLHVWSDLDEASVTQQVMKAGCSHWLWAGNRSSRRSSITLLWGGEWMSFHSCQKQPDCTSVSSCSLSVQPDRQLVAVCLLCHCPPTVSLCWSHLYHGNITPALLDAGTCSF